MKKRTKRIIFGTLGFLSLTILGFMLYFYIGFSGNPIVGYQQQREIIRIYERMYTEDFVKISSSYDYKRDEYSFNVSSKSHPEIIFTTTLDEANQIDKYAQAQSIKYLNKVIDDSLGTDFDHLQYRVNVYEDNDSPGLMEHNPITRLNLNHYVVDFSWDTPLLDPLEVESLFAEMTERIAGHLDTPVGRLKIRVGVYDGKNYHNGEIDLN